MMRCGEQKQLFSSADQSASTLANQSATTLANQTTASFADQSASTFANQTTSSLVHFARIAVLLAVVELANSVVSQGAIVAKLRDFVRVTAVRHRTHATQVQTDGLKPAVEATTEESQ